MISAQCPASKALTRTQLTDPNRQEADSIWEWIAAQGQMQLPLFAIAAAATAAALHSQSIFINLLARVNQLITWPVYFISLRLSPPFVKSTWVIVPRFPMKIAARLSHTKPFSICQQEATLTPPTTNTIEWKPTAKKTARKLRQPSGPSAHMAQWKEFFEFNSSFLLRNCYKWGLKWRLS